MNRGMPAGLLLAGLALVGVAVPAEAAPVERDERDRRIERLQRQLEALAAELAELKAERAAEKAAAARQREALARRIEQVEQAGRGAAAPFESWLNKFRLGGYGEMHANFAEGASPDLFDIHRLVLYLGYDFSDWIQFHSEIELEHAFVSDGSGGELSLEQAYVDFLLNDRINIRVGRILTPIGIINKKHEPPSFNGVERPAFAKFIIPTTWSSDSIGIFGNLTRSLEYELYVVGGLDGSKFDAIKGIREGRIQERPSLHDVALTGRLDYYPFAERSAPHGQTLRLGASTYFGGIDNGNKGRNPGIDGHIHVYSGDVEYSIGRFDFRGALAYIQIDGARKIGNGTASDIFGWYLEAAYHFWPDAWKKHKLEKADAVVFVRYDDFDTQFRMPSHVRADPAGDRSEWTFGIGFYPQPNFVIKADYQVPDDATGRDLDQKFNLGLGWQF